MVGAEAFLWGMSGLLVAAGLLGVIVPVIPGAPLVFGGLLLGAWIDGFERVGWPSIVILGVLTVATVVLDLAASSWGVKRLRASRLAIAGAALGAIVGVLFGLPGLVFGPFVGAVAGEYWARRDLRQAGKVGLGAWIGLILASAAKLVVVFLMIGWFVVAYV